MFNNFTMKKSVFLLVLLISAITFQSCEKDESLDPRAQQIPGMFARLDITNKYINPIDFTNSYFGGELTNPSGKIVKYNLYVKKSDGLATSKTVLIKTVTTFPYDLKIYAADLQAALNLPVEIGNFYYFWAESFDKDGNRADYYSLSSTVQGAPGMKQAYRFSTLVFDYSTDPVGLSQIDNYINP
jgi:hypothetical protein